MSNHSTKYIEFSILAIVTRGNACTLSAVYTELRKNPAYSSLPESEFNEKWNYLIETKCLIPINNTEPEKGVKINTEKSCLITYGFQKYSEEHKKQVT